MLGGKSFVVFTLAVCSALVAIVGASIYCIDPYGMNESLLIDKLNYVKPESATHARLSLAAVISRRAPSVVALGTSRALRGISMDHPGWAGELSERYNAALMGANIYEIVRYFEHAEQTQALRQAVLGLDFFSFNAYKQNAADFDEALLLRYGDAVSIKRHIERLKTYVSNDTLYSSYRTVQGNLVQWSPPFLGDGRENPAGLEASIVLGGGQHHAFILSAMVALTNLNFPPPYRRAALEGAHGERPVRELGRMIDIARKKHVDLRLFISPAHARQWEALRVAGLWDEFERWKRELVLVLEQDAARHPSEVVIPLWDFSGYSSISTEPVPVAGDSTSRMKWYWESSHYRKEVGDLVLDRVFGYRDLQRTVPDDFGVLLTQRNLDGHLAEIREEGIGYRETHREDIVEIESLARKVAQERKERELRRGRR